MLQTCRGLVEARGDRALWYSLTLEFLVRAALATIHPALLAESSASDTESLLFAFGGPSPKRGPRSIGLVEALRRLRVLRPEFLEEEATLCATFASARKRSESLYPSFASSLPENVENGLVCYPARDHAPPFVGG